MDAQDLVMMIVKASGGRIEGRTVVQKLAYFTCVKLGLRDIGYVDYFYGPFSKDVARALEDMVALEFVQETVRATPIEKYTYAITEDGQVIAEDIAGQCAPELGAIKDIVESCRDHCGLRANPLSCAAKVHYITNNPQASEVYTTGNIRVMAGEFGWNMSDQEIEEGATLFSRLGLDGNAT